MTDQEATVMAELTNARTAMEILRNVGGTEKTRAELRTVIKDLERQFVEAVRPDREKRFGLIGVPTDREITDAVKGR